jgi:ADP-ribose pyrophosphatase YjhB (NUDIX family)
MSDHEPLTHRVAAAAYIFRGDRLLLLKRNKPPFTFAPPGGHLNEGEDPISGLHREVQEETGLSIDVIGVAHMWFGVVADGYEPLLCINYLAVNQTGDVQINHEHTEFKWVSREDIESGATATLSLDHRGYQTKDILTAFDLYARIRPR